MKFYLLIFIFFGASCAFSQTNAPLRLWYTSPAEKTWESALPIGNGRVGAMIYGNVAEELIQLNEHTVWSGSPNRNDNLLSLDSLAIIRQLIFEGKQKEAERIANRVIITKKSHGQMFQPVADFRIAFTGHDMFSNYSRELNIEKAIATTSYTIAGVQYTRQSFASLTDRVIVMRLTASKRNSISFEARFSNTLSASKVNATSSHDLIVTGTTNDHEGIKGLVKFKGIARMKLEGGTIESGDSSVTISNANAVTIYISIASSFKNYHDISGDHNALAKQWLDQAYRKPFASLLQAHIAGYQKYFNRVKLDLGNTSGVERPTDERLKNFNSGDDPQLVTLYYQYGRYLLISSSQPGGQPANLQGIWNNKTRPPWDSKYTININAEMNYWPAEKTNLSELHEPFLTMVKELSITGQQTAKDMYGTRGWVAHHNTDIWRTTGAIDGAFWGAWNAGGAWTSQHLWDHYLYNGDKKFLASAYDVLKGAALFYVDYLIEHPTKRWLVANPDMSPENAPKAHQGSSLDAGTTMTNQIVFDIFSSTIRAAEILKRDASFIDTLKQMRKRLPPMQIGQHGQLQEWLDDIDDPKDNHRHVSHLYGLFPSNQISAYRTPQLYSAAKTTLTQRGDISTGWSMGWKVNWWARMLDGNHAYKLIKDQLTPVGTNEGGGGTYKNLFDAHPPFQIDGNFGCTSGITEMLMQSSDGTLHLLPAIPDVWQKQGSITGLRAIGGFEIVSMKWNDGKVSKVVIKSKLGGNLRIRVPNAMKSGTGSGLKKAAGENKNPFYQVENGASPVISSKAMIVPIELKPTLLYDIPTTAGKTYILISQ